MAAQQSHGAPQGAPQVLVRPRPCGGFTAGTAPAASQAGRAAGCGKWSAAAGPEPATVPSWCTSPDEVLAAVRAWGATIVLSACPNALLETPGWAGTGATCVPVGGDGYNEVCHMLLEQGSHDEATI
eukprot:629412-Lingulodinium_polyedra.AAC.1